MAQHLLNNTQIRSVFQKMRGEGMTQDMRENMLFQSCGSGAFPENLTNPLPRQRTAAYCQKDVAFRSRPDQFGSSFFQIHLQSIQSGSPYGHQPGFIPLPQHADKSFIFIKTL